MQNILAMPNIMRHVKHFLHFQHV